MADRKQMAIDLLCGELQTSWSYCDPSCISCKFYHEESDMGARVSICVHGFGGSKESCGYYMTQHEYLEFVRSGFANLKADNDMLREQIERLQPIDCEGNVLDIADTVSMLRSEYDGDHEWNDVVVELALTKWGGDRWIVRGSKGEAWACDCTKTGYDEDAYEGSDDAEPIVNPSLIESENAKLRELCSDTHVWMSRALYEGSTRKYEYESITDRMRELGVVVDG